MEDNIKAQIKIDILEHSDNIKDKNLSRAGKTFGT
jgi:hypothetical protein